MSAAPDASASNSEEQQVTFNIKASNDQKFVLTLPANTTVGDIKTKLSTSEYADLPVERIRLIYSGRVLKDVDTLAATKIKDGHTIHMVKGAASNARQNPAAQSSTPAAPGTTPSAAAPAANVPQNLATGTGNNPLAQLTGARYAGFHGLPSASTFGADGGMGPPPGPDEMLRMLDDPNFVQQMNEMMNSPHFQQILEQSPAFRDNPMARQMMRDPNLRRMMLDPNMLRLQLQMQRSMGGGGDGGNGSFPAPGVTNTTPQQGGAANPATGAGQTGGAAGSPFASVFGDMMGGGQANPFAALLGTPPPMSVPSTTGGTTQGTGSTDAPTAAGTTNTGAAGQENPWAQMAAAMSAMQGGEGGGAAAGNPFASLFGGGGFGGMPQQPPDNRPPEERYAEQLRQLNDMGFFDFDRNVQALRRSGGSVQGAIEHLLSGA